MNRRCVRETALSYGCAVVDDVLRLLVPRVVRRTWKRVVPL